jgi:hypothetical protein
LSVYGADNECTMICERIDRWAVLLLGLVVLSCRKPDYFPLKQNQEWRYTATEYEVAPSDTTVTGNRTYAVTVTGSAVEPGIGKVYEVRITRDEEPYLSFFFRKARNAVFVLPASHLDGLEPTSGWVKLLELPLRAGAFWYGDEERSVSFEVMARETVETTMGRFRDCFRIRIHAPEPYLMDVWLAPDAGIIRWQRTFSAVRSEKSVRICR